MNSNYKLAAQESEFEFEDKLQWRDSRSRNRTSRTTMITTTLVLGSLVFGYWARGAIPFNKFQRKVESCNPYSYPGYIISSKTSLKDNVFKPFDSPCEPVDFISEISRINQPGGVEAVGDSLKWAANKTILFYGDSIERNLLVDFCDETGSELTLIDNERPLLDIPYPVGQELPPDDYVNFLTKDRTWPYFNVARPHVCRVKALNLNIVSVFHYSTKQLDKHLNYHPHFYPPATYESRFKAIALPLLERLHEVDGVAPIPDIVVVSPGFWGLMRDGIADQKLGLDPYRSMDSEKIQETVESVENMIEVVSQAWSESSKPPKILYRMLHQTIPHDTIPNPRIHTLNAIGKQVISKFNKNSPIKIEIDEWATQPFVSGLERFFRDLIHPGPQSSHFFSQTLLNHLKMNA